MEKLRELVEEYKKSINDLPPEILSNEVRTIEYFLEWVEKFKPNFLEDNKQHIRHCRTQFIAQSSQKTSQTINV